MPIRGGTGQGVRCSSISLAVRLTTIPLPIPFLSDLALLVGLTGLFTVIMGVTALKRYWFAFFFLVFMVPLPSHSIRRLLRLCSYLPAGLPRR